VRIVVHGIVAPPQQVRMGARPTRDAKYDPQRHTVTVTVPFARAGVDITIDR